MFWSLRVLALDGFYFVVVEGHVVLDALCGAGRLAVGPRSAVGLFAIDGEVEVAGNAFPVAGCVAVVFREVLGAYGFGGK